MPKRAIIFSEFKKRFDDVSDGEYEYISGYKSMSQKITIKHITCGHIFNPIATSFINTGTRCKICNHAKRTSEEYKNIVEEITNKEYSISSEYNGKDEDISFIHNKCGRTYISKPRNFSVGNRCPYCSNRSYPYTVEELQEIADYIYKDVKIIKYNATARIVEYKCTICNDIGRSNIINFKKGLDLVLRKTCCDKEIKARNISNNKLIKLLKTQLTKKIKEENFSNKMNELIKEVKNIHGSEVTIIECESTNKEYPLIAKCNNCNELFITKFRYLLRGHSCPECNISKGERKIKNYLEKNNIDFIREYSFDDLKVVNKLRFDFAIFKNNDLFCLIEYDGEQHFNINTTFGSSKDKNIEFNKTTFRDSKKNEYCKKNNINLLRISYKDFKIIDQILDELLL